MSSKGAKGDYTQKIRIMLPFIRIGSFSLPTFGIMLWLAAVCACWVLHRNFRRWNVTADAVGIVAVATVAGIIGAKFWHVLETPKELFAHPAAEIFSRDGFAWFGGLVFGILALIYQGRVYKLGALAMLDFAAPSAAIGYGVGRLGCLISGDGDYGIPTSLPWGMSFPNGLVPTDQRVHPTPIYELLVGLLIGWILWRRGAERRPIGQLTGEYLVFSGVARFLVEFIRINPRIYLGMSNAQLASIGSVVAGVLLILWAKSKGVSVEVNRPTLSVDEGTPKIVS
jgi:phosphatidylglycerol---prolipoprotein diacylglyceryl transferase